MADRIKIWRKKYCVYRHWVKGELIYVGKGTISRPFLLNGKTTVRNRRWGAIVDDEMEVEIVSWHDTEEEAIQAEREEIARSNPTTNGYFPGPPKMSIPSVKVVIRLPVKLHEQLTEMAARDRRSLNSTMIRLLEKQMDEDRHDPSMPWLANSQEGR